MTTNESALQTKLEALNQLVELSLVMNSTLKLTPLLTCIMEAATDITGAEAASILLVDKYTQQLHFAASTGSDSEQLAGIMVPREGSLAGKIIETDEALIIDDVAESEYHFGKVGEVVEFETRSLLGVPMRIKDKTVGVLEILNKTDGNFSSDDAHHAAILASQAATAIENAQLVAALRKAYEDLNALDALKSNFIAIASHELRTPLAIILGYASHLHDTSEGESVQHAAEVVNGALRLRGLIESMVNLQYVNIDSNELEFQDCTVDEVVQIAYLDIHSTAASRNNELIINLPEEPINIHADPDMLAMALTNILNNAVNFSAEGEDILISAETHGKEVWIKFADKGVGLKPEHFEKVFDQFYQVEDPMIRKHGGLGLGLSIAQAIVNRHDGRIWVECEGLNQGSTFVVALPRTA